MDTWQLMWLIVDVLKNYIKAEYHYYYNHMALGKNSIDTDEASLGK